MPRLEKRNTTLLFGAHNQDITLFDHRLKNIKMLEQEYETRINFMCLKIVSVGEA